MRSARGQDYPKRTQAIDNDRPGLSFPAALFPKVLDMETRYWSVASNGIGRNEQASAPL